MRRDLDHMRMEVSNTRVFAKQDWKRKGAILRSPLFGGPTRHYGAREENCRTLLSRGPRL